VSESAKGVLLGVLTYAFWGIVPIYFKMIARADPLEILAHRIVWSVAVLLILITAFRRWTSMRRIGSDIRALRFLAGSTLAVALNWYIFIWAVTHNHLLEASLGYFINPLVSVLLGFVFLRERLRPVEWISIGLATIAVLWMTIAAGVFPAISLGVAFSFGLYGLLRKVAGVPSLQGLAIETAMLLPVAGGYLLVRAAAGTIAFGHISMTFDALLVAAGPITAIPLLTFVAAVRRLRLATIGLLQYITPTLQFAIAVSIFREPLNRTRLLAFALIWIAVAIYSGTNLIVSEARLESAEDPTP
jgi:chloramphenicol-sensitive protein RarD